MDFKWTKVKNHFSNTILYFGMVSLFSISNCRWGKLGGITLITVKYNTAMWIKCY